MNKITPVADHFTEQTYKIEKDLYVDKWIVWEVHKNYKINKFQGTEKQCYQWIKKQNKKDKKGKRK